MIFLLLGAAALVVAGAGFLVRVPLLRSVRIPAAITGSVLVVAGVLQPSPPPGSQLANPVPRTVDSVARGARLYSASCAVCHGPDGRGGPAPTGTTVVPPPLTGPGSHLGAHTDGNLHEIIANGLPGGMPAWAGSLDDDSIWDLVNFLRVLDGASIAPGAGGSPPAPSGHQRG